MLACGIIHATIEEFAADGYTHVECFCPRCRMTRLVHPLPPTRKSPNAAQPNLANITAALDARQGCGAAAIYALLFDVRDEIPGGSHSLVDACPVSPKATPSDRPGL